MINFDFNKDCYSCGLCEKICPTNAISMHENLLGFRVPKIEVDKCINCKKCDNSCIFLNANDSLENIYAADAYAVYSINDQVRYASSSGGVFSEIANAFVKNGNYVCGCVWNQKMEPVHIVSNKAHDIERMRGSKYVQSNLGDCYEKILSILKENKNVLFTGTPCQIAAMYNFVGNPPNFYTMSVICHGVASPKIWESYINNITPKNDEIVDINMKDKTIGWKDSGYKIHFKSRPSTFKISSLDATFQKAYIKSLIIKDKCFTCQYKNIKIKADIIVGDFWGLPKEIENLDDDIGISSMLVLTSKGKDIFNDIKGNIYWKAVDNEKIYKGNERLIMPTIAHKDRDYFIAEFLEDSSLVSKLLWRYIGPHTFIEYSKYYLKLFLKEVGLYRKIYRLRLNRRKSNNV